ncbi:MAG: hypothetical protein K2I42_03440 [Anaeroplasmataceae bacterium]|nr:hypothetical protein [Anaeroplasmataceae bacterium]
MGYTTYAKQLNCKLDQIPTGCHKSHSGNNLNVIHSELKLWLKKYWIFYKASSRIFEYVCI